MFDKSANRNTIWAHMFVSELVRAGLRAVVIAPGSRSTPLAMEFGSQPELEVFVHPDERGAAFFALGLSLESGRAAAVLCTSGTAAANFFPAVVEAHQANVPLLVLTADRPAELRDSGANQVIDQVKIFGGFTRWSMEVALPEDNPSELTVRYLHSLADRAMAAAGGLRPGPVHLNFPFRKPLEPAWAIDDGPSPRLIPDGAAAYVKWSSGRVAATQEQIEGLGQAVRTARRGLIYCGPRCPGGEFPQAVRRLAAVTGYPILADALSGVRFGYGADNGAAILGGFETFLRTAGMAELPGPELIVQFGAAPISTALGEYLGGQNASRRVMIESSGAWSDDTFTTHEFIQADPADSCLRLAAHLLSGGPIPIDEGWSAAWMARERHAWQVFERLRGESTFEGALAACILDELKAGDALFVASSLPVRHLDQFGRPRPHALQVYANRGASGIDGTIASAAGVSASRAARHPDQRTVLLIGDLAFYHDLNSLLLLKKYPQNLTIVLINNDGGGIFERLPVASFEPLFTQLFRAPHGLHFGEAARLFGLDYREVGPGKPGGAGEPGRPFGEFQAAVQAALAAGGVHVIEAAGDARVNDGVRQEWIQRYNQTWKGQSDSGD